MNVFFGLLALMTYPEDYKEKRISGRAKYAYILPAYALESTHSYCGTESG